MADNVSDSPETYLLLVLVSMIDFLVGVLFAAHNLSLSTLRSGGLRDLFPCSWTRRVWVLIKPSILCFRGKSVCKTPPKKKAGIDGWMDGYFLHTSPTYTLNPGDLVAYFCDFIGQRDFRGNLGHFA